jgi:DNA replication protein DnaC
MNGIQQKLKEFKLSGMGRTFQERLDYAEKNSMPYKEFLEILLEDEGNNRKDNNYKKRCLQARLPSKKTIEDFDFSFQPSIDKKQINTISTCQFIKETKNIIFVGKPGTGKTHLSIGIGIKGLQKGHKVLFTGVGEMLRNLHSSKADNSYTKKVREYLAPDLLILDELGFKKIPDYSADDFFDIISKRYEKGSLIITTNKPIDQWGEIFSDNILASAISDRIVHHSEIIKVMGPSFRSKNIVKNQEGKIA